MEPIYVLYYHRAANVVPHLAVNNRRTRLTMDEKFFAVRADGIMSVHVSHLRDSFSIRSEYRFCLACGGLALVFPMNQDAKQYFESLGYIVNDFRPIESQDFDLPF